MTLSLTGFRFLSSFLLSVTFLVAGIGMGMAAEQDSPAQAVKMISADVQHQTTTVRLDASDLVGKSVAASSSSVLVALPPSASSFQIEAHGGQVSVPDGIMTMRGQPVIKAIIDGVTSAEVTINVEHNGNWADKPITQERLFSPAMNAALGATYPNNFATETSVSGGAYVIIYPPAFQTAILPLVDWKMRKGLRVQTVSTSITGTTTAGIKAWIQDAYDSNEFPPEYILLAGDVGDIPTYSFHGNPSDVPYIQLDGEDWIPDAMIGRLPGENLAQVETMINKIINYERNPAMADPSWFTNAVGVVGQYASNTPLHTVRYCMDQLETIGFAPADTATYIPPPTHYGNFIVSGPQNDGTGSPPWGIVSGMGADHIKNAIDAGSSMVIYRGWAYGTLGWDPPTYKVTDIGALDNGARLPVVMSFVCLTGDYTHSQACFGEAFIREGTPTEPLGGAIAFIGNGEHWSHTRYNDAMAMSFFERIVEDNITDLGTLMTAGKMRFMDFFPHEMNAAEFEEESVEFYFHIYNLLGDPELNFWKQEPIMLSVVKPGSVTPGQNSLSLQVFQDDEITAVANARVGIIQDGQLIGCAFTDVLGAVTVPLSGIASGSLVEITVTGSGLHPLETTIATDTALAFLGITEMTMDDGVSAGTGNADGNVNPGETLSLTPIFTNAGSETAPVGNIQMSILSGNAVAVTSTSTVASLAPGASFAAGTPLSIQLADDAFDGEIISVGFDVSHGGNHDLTSWTFEVNAPKLAVLTFTLADGSQPIPGQTNDLVLSLQNIGSAATTGGVISLELVAGGDNTLTGNETSFGAIAPGETVVSEGGVSLEIASATATGTNLSFNMATVFSENSTASSTCALVVGPVDVSMVVGPDDYGYYAYDSADYDYPANRPIYQWQEISTAFDGLGTAIELTQSDNYALDLVVELPFDSFQYYGQQFTEIRISENGWIAFDTDPFFNFYNWTIPTTHGNDALVAPFWDNLNPYLDPVDPQPGPNGVLRDGIYTYHDQDNGRFIVEWSRLPHYKPEILGLQTFQVILLDPALHTTSTGDGEILFMYREVVNNDNLRNFATVGIESPDGTDGLQLSYGAINAAGMAPIQPGLAVKLTTTSPVRVPYAVDHLNAASIAGITTLSWTVSDPRPVLGWHVDRISNQGRSRLTEQPLAGIARTFDHADPLSHEADGEISYVLTALHPYGTTSQPGETTVQTTASFQLALFPAQPNPASGESTIGFSLPRDAVASLKVYDLAGRCVRTLLDGAVSSGQEFILWDGRGNGGLPVADGIYFYRLETGGQTLTRKLTFVR